MRWCNECAIDYHFWDVKNLRSKLSQNALPGSSFPPRQLLLPFSALKPKTPRASSAQRIA